MIVQNRYTFDAHRVTGRHIKETASIPLGFALYRRVQGGNEPIRDDAQVELPKRRSLLRSCALERVMNARTRTLVTLLGAVAVEAPWSLVRAARPRCRGWAKEVYRRDPDRRRRPSTTR